MKPVHVINFYRFTPLANNVDIWVSRLTADLAQFEVLGTIVLASEGINGSLAGDEAVLQMAFQTISSYPPFADMTYRSSYGSTQPYQKLIVRAKRQILTFPIEHEPKVDDILAGPALSPEEWENLLATKPKDLIVLDTRNQYEIEVGSFDGAEDLKINRFRDFPQKFVEQYEGSKNKTFLMYCTGGIRCEKAVAYARNQGFEKAYKLDGGIIDYLRQKGSKYWNGECFVFDQRWTIAESRDEGHSLDNMKKNSEV